MLMASMAFVACKKDEVVLPTATSEATKATLTGTLYAELDWNTPGLEKVPDGVSVTATIDMSGKTFSYSGVTASGKYTIDIPVGGATRNYTLYFGNFTADQTQLVGQLPTTVSKNYTLGNSVATLVGGVTTTKNFTYVGASSASGNNNSDGVVVGKAFLIGKAMYNSNLINDTTNTWARDGKPGVFANHDGYADDNDETNVPDGTKVTFVTTGNKRYETTVSAGVFKFEIEMDNAGNTSVSGTLSFDEFSAAQVQSPATSFPASLTKIFKNAGKIYDGGFGNEAPLKAGLTKNGGESTDWNGVKYYKFN